MQNTPSKRRAYDQWVTEVLSKRINRPAPMCLPSIRSGMRKLVNAFRGRGEGSRDRSIKGKKKKKERNDFSTITSFWRSLFLGGKGGAVLCFRLVESRFIGQPVKVGVSRVISAGGSRRGNRIESSIVLCTYVRTLDFEVISLVRLRYRLSLRSLVMLDLPFGNDWNNLLGFKLYSLPGDGSTRNIRV